MYGISTENGVLPPTVYIYRRSVYLVYNLREYQWWYEKNQQNFSKFVNLGVNAVFAKKAVMFVFNKIIALSKK